MIIRIPRTMIIMSNARNPWKSREWRVLREEKIGNFCQQCGSNKDILVLQHLWHPPSNARLRVEIAYEMRLTPEDPRVISEAYRVSNKLHERYMSCDDTETWCRKCAYMWDIHHKKLCPKCKLEYCDINYEECYKCHRKKVKEILDSSMGDLFQDL
jgi:hypothetical protein